MSDCLDAGAKASRRKRPRSHFIAALVATNGCFSLALIPGDIHHHHRTRRPHDTRRLISARFQVNIANHGDMENDFTGDSVACTDASRTSDRLNPAKVQAAHNQLGLEACDSRVTAAVTSLAVNRTEEAECTLQQDEDETHLLDGMVDGVIAS
ncbi:hypothetical protein CcaverHIS002_0301510 [Cutaneotrichosporon cavernicola]|nr:hypothetical protein CcaverHIS002_0301510 [Cutaneotrichosporon cavernicola]